MNHKPIITGLLLTASIAMPVGAETYSPQHQAVVKHFQGPEEKTAKDAVWTSRKILKVGVLDNGTPRDGYASYVCQVLYDQGFKGQQVWVQIIDIAKLTRTNKWVKLGEARCE